MNEIPRISLCERLKSAPDTGLTVRFYTLFPDDLCAALDAIYLDGFFDRVYHDRILPRIPGQVPYLAKLLGELPLDPPDGEITGLLYMILVEPFVHNKQGVFL